MTQPASEPGRVAEQGETESTTLDPLLLAPPDRSVVPGARPQFSVVIAAYQAAGHIREAVDSVLAQTEPPTELVVCDDGSTDDLAGALAPYEDSVRLVRIPHAGASAAKNAGVAATTAPWVVFLDADDSWAPTRLARLGDLGQARPDLDILSTDAWFVIGGHRSGRFHGPQHPFPTEDQAVVLLRRDWVFAGAAVRRGAWDQVGGFDVSVAYAEDWDCWLRMVLGGSQVGCVDEPLVDYVIHDRSVSADRSGSLGARVVVLDRIMASFELSPPQRAAASEMRAESVRRARLARAERALVNGGGARRACVTYGVSPGLGHRQRVRALAAAVAPRWAASRLRQEAARSGRARSDRAGQESTG